MLFKIFLITSLILSGYTQKILKCSERGGCFCDCSWTKQTPCKIARDDNTCCYSCCCSRTTPTEPTSRIDPSSKIAQKLYCPSKNDLVVSYGSSQLFDQGWLNRGGGGVATKSSFNLLGGYVEFDIDFTNLQTGINGNIYTISPKGIPSTGFTQKNYCDGAKKTQNDWCTEIDWIESNGNCGGALTLHTIMGIGEGCTAWGCRKHFMYNGKTSYHVKITYDEFGKITMYRDKEIITSKDIKPFPLESDWKTLVEAYQKEGAVIYSSLWKGWVPLEKTCPGNGDLSTSSFHVKNLRIKGKVIQGNEPTLCLQK